MPVPRKPGYDKKITWGQRLGVNSSQQLRHSRREWRENMARGYSPCPHPYAPPPARPTPGCSAATTVARLVDTTSNRACRLQMSIAVTMAWCLPSAQITSASVLSSVLRHRRLTPRTRGESTPYHADRRPICALKNTLPSPCAVDTDSRDVPHRPTGPRRLRTWITTNTY